MIGFRKGERKKKSHDEKKMSECKEFLKYDGEKIKEGGREFIRSIDIE